MTQIVHFLTNIGPVADLQPEFPTSKDPFPFIQRKKVMLARAQYKNELIYLTREGDKVNNRALTIHVVKTRLILGLSV